MGITTAQPPYAAAVSVQGRVARALRKYGKILRISLVERLVYRADFLVSTLVRFLPLMTSFLLWEAVYTASGREDIAGYTRDTTLAYLLLVQISRMFSSMPGLSGGIARDIRDGNLKKYLLQPIDMHAYLLASRGAHKLAYIATAALPHALLFWWFRDVFPPLPDALTLLAYVLSLLLSFVIGFFFEAAIGTSGFWLLEVTSLVYIVNAVNFFISGQMFPLDFLDPWLGETLKYLPFKYLAYFPATVFLGRTTGAEMWIDLLVEFGWAIAFVVLARCLYRAGLRRYSAFGG